MAQLLQLLLQLQVVLDLLAWVVVAQPRAAGAQQVPAAGTNSSASGGSLCGMVLPGAHVVACCAQMLLLNMVVCSCTRHSCACCYGVAACRTTNKEAPFAAKP
jgi:hypothetical protein